MVITTSTAEAAACLSVMYRTATSLVQKNVINLGISSGFMISMSRAFQALSWKGC